MKRIQFDVQEWRHRAAMQPSGPRAGIETLLPAGEKFFSEVRRIDADELLSTPGKKKGKADAFRILRAAVEEQRAERPGTGSGAYQYRIKFEREQSAKKLNVEPDPREQAARERRAERFLRSLEACDSLEIRSVFWALPAEYRETLEEAGVRIYRASDNSIRVERWIPVELAEESRAQRMAAIDPEAAKLIESLESERREIEHFETLLLNSAMDEAGVEEDQIRVA